MEKASEHFNLPGTKPGVSGGRKVKKKKTVKKSKKKKRGYFDLMRKK